MEFFKPKFGKPKVHASLPIQGAMSAGENDMRTTSTFLWVNNVIRFYTTCIGRILVGYPPNIEGFSPTATTCAGGRVTWKEGTCRCCVSAKASPFAALLLISEFCSQFLNLFVDFATLLHATFITRLSREWR